MTQVMMADCIGLWRRTLLVDAGGARDSGTDVRWLQGISAYVDSRGFAGWLSQRGDVFEWSRLIDLEPAGSHPDAGRMSWDGDTLVENGVHADYIERWHRDPAPLSPCWALTLCSDDAGDALLLRVGDHFGWVRPGTRLDVLLGRIDGASWIRPRLRDDNVYIDGVRWRVKDREGTVKL